MKGSEKTIEMLNKRLKEELTAINQYFVHAEMCEDWGYKRLKEYTKKRSIQEMKHAEALIERILFLEGQPTVSQLNPIHIGKSVEQQIRNDLEAEVDAVKAYNDGIGLAVDERDNGTRDLLESILSDEEEHLDWLETQVDQIEQMGLERYLAEQTHEER